MARIPENELERLKADVDLAELVRSSGVELKRRGKDLVGLCPFHQETQPSLVVTPSKNLWHCLGCGVGGSVVDWVMKSEGVSFRHAVELLREGRAGGGVRPVKRSTVRRLPPPVELEAADHELLLQVVDFYHRTLKDSAEALAYLKRRGLDDGEAIDRFKLGYANRTLGLRLPNNQRKAGREIRGRLVRLGIFRKTGHEHLAGSLTIPVFDPEGRVGELYGRKIQRALRKGTPKHLYISGQHRGVWNLDAFRASKEIILCEALIDALTFWCAGYRHVTSSYGANGFTSEMLEAMKAYGIERVLIAYDRDDKSEPAAKRLAAKLGAEGISCFRVLFPKGMDANEYACHVKPPAKSLGLLLRSAEYMTGPVNSLSVVRCQLSEGEGRRGEQQERVQGSEGVAEGDGSCAGGLQGGEGVSARGALRSREPVEAGGGERAGEHRGGAGTATSEGVSPGAVRRERQSCGGGDAPDRGPAVGLRERAGSSGDRGSDHRRENAAAGSHQQPSHTATQPAPNGQLTTGNGQLTTGNGQLTTDNGQLPVSISDHEIVLTLGDRRWRIRGLARNMSFEQLRVNVLVSLHGQRPTGNGPPATANGQLTTDNRQLATGFHVDTFDLYSAKHRAGFVKQAAAELGIKEDVVKKDLGRVLLKLEELQEEQIRATLEPKEKAVTISDSEREEALQLLKDPKLLSRVVADLEACGLVGEETNKLTAYLAATSRKLAEPLAVLVQSSSAAGKSALMNAVLEMMPPEERVAYSAMTGQSLFYMGEADLKHKVLAIAEEEGAERASYALKLLQSEGELSIASTGKDPHTGKLVTQEYRVEGPVAIMLTTTAIDLDEELLNRCVVLSVDEGREQTRAIHELQRQRRTPEGLVAWRRREKLLALHQNAQRLLRPLPVGNPYAARLTFLDARTRTRRDHAKYLTLIEAVTLLHQHQRPIRRIRGRDGEAVEYVETTPEDIAIANRLAAEVLGRSLDELPPQTRRLLELIWEMVSAECERRQIDQADYRFSRREVLDWTGFSLTQVRAHMARLVESEFVLVHHGTRGQRFVYELLWKGEGREGERFVLGLLDPETLDGYGYDGKVTGSGGEVAGPAADLAGRWRPHGGGVAGGWRDEETAAKGRNGEDLPPLAADSAENTLLGGKKTALSYTDARHSRRSLSLAATGGAADEEKRL